MPGFFVCHLYVAPVISMSGHKKSRSFPRLLRFNWQKLLGVTY
jgi:hypothetical protein